MSTDARFWMAPYRTGRYGYKWQVWCQPEGRRARIYHSGLTRVEAEAWVQASTLSEPV